MKILGRNGHAAQAVLENKFLVGVFCDGVLKEPGGKQSLRQRGREAGRELSRPSEGSQRPVRKVVHL